MAVQGLRIPRVIIAAILMAISANCFLKYLWWTAFYTGGYSFASHSQQLKTASFRASFFFWSVIALEAANFAIIWSLIPLRYTDLSRFLKYGARLVASFTITVAGTALLVFALSWAQLGIR